jgi:hypothetical protein
VVLRPKEINILRADCKFQVNTEIAARHNRAGTHQGSLPPDFCDLLASDPEPDPFGRLRAAESIGRPLGSPPN